ncbi:uncharacterized protein LOC108112341 [Drosophila eugracilis]|uniref:uncharacterized protein LOC108112341 n=1 Tax=Drosophila eugracilis TaxID=29029 RepID=UPI0007E67265|nr:uncharacterized protein LOC108112341 [Drosophila eugracilis]
MKLPIILFTLLGTVLANPFEYYNNGIRDSHGSPNGGLNGEHSGFQSGGQIGGQEEYGSSSFKSRGQSRVYGNQDYQYDDPRLVGFHYQEGQKVESVPYIQSVRQNEGLRVNAVQYSNHAGQYEGFNGRRQTSRYTGFNNEEVHEVQSVPYSQNANKHAGLGLGVNRVQDSNQGGQNGLRQTFSDSRQTRFNNDERQYPQIGGYDGRVEIRNAQVFGERGSQIDQFQNERRTFVGQDDKNRRLNGGQQWYNNNQEGFGDQESMNGQYERLPVSNDNEEDKATSLRCSFCRKRWFKNIPARRIE